MKLLYCRKCGDIFPLEMERVRGCQCGRTQGKYLDRLNAIYAGVFAVPIGFRNDSLKQAIENQPESGRGCDFTAFVIEKKCPTFVRIDTPKIAKALTSALTQQISDAQHQTRDLDIQPKRAKKK